MDRQRLDSCIRTIKTNHKEEDYGIGEESIFVKQCHSVRVAYVFSASCDTQSVELMHLYEPMGLSRQHDAQGSLLARMRCHALAACLLKIAQKHLHMLYMPSACICTVPENSYKKITPQEIQAPWNSRVSNMRLETRPSFNYDFIMDLRDNQWEQIQVMLTEFSGDVLQKEILRMKQIMTGLMEQHQLQSSPVHVRTE